MQVYPCEYLLYREFHDGDLLAYSRPVPFDCVVKPRFGEVGSLLAEERERFGIQI